MPLSFRHSSFPLETYGYHRVHAMFKSQRIGSANRNIAPLPTSLSAQIWPP